MSSSRIAGTTQAPAAKTVATGPLGPENPADQQHDPEDTAGDGCSQPGRSDGPAGGPLDDHAQPGDRPEQLGRERDSYDDGQDRESPETLPVPEDASGQEEPDGHPSRDRTRCEQRQHAQHDVNHRCRDVPAGPAQGRSDRTSQGPAKVPEAATPSLAAPLLRNSGEYPPIAAGAAWGDIR